MQEYSAEYLLSQYHIYLWLLKMKKHDSGILACYFALKKNWNISSSSSQYVNWNVVF